MAAPRLLVTGHLGFIASAFCWNYHQRYDIVGVDFAGWGSMAQNLAPICDSHCLDIADAPAINALIDTVSPIAIVNFAAESHVDRSVYDDEPFWRSNVLGPRVLAQAALRSGVRLLHVSTDEVYGDASDNDAAWDERSSLDPRNPYSASKAAAELMLGAYHHTFGLDVVMTRGANTIGPRQFPEKAVPKAIGCFLSDRPFPLFRTPARRMWMHVDDHVAGILCALERGESGETYNLGPDPSCEAYTHNVIDQVRTLVGRGEVREVDDRAGYDLRYRMSAAKAHAALGWRAQHDLAATLNDTVTWYLDNQRWLRDANAQLQRASEAEANRSAPATRSS